jgi:hypothetical protein
MCLTAAAAMTADGGQRTAHGVLTGTWTRGAGTCSHMSTCIEGWPISQDCNAMGSMAY